MFAAIYRWRVRPGQDQDFVRGWYLTSTTVRERFGAIGSRLHRTADGLYVSYGRWKAREDRDPYLVDLAVHPQGFKLMQGAIAEESPPIDMRIVGNLLGEDDVPEGLFVDLGAELSDATVAAPRNAVRGDEGGPASTSHMTLRCEIFPEDIEATRDFYTRVLRFRVQRHVVEWPGPYLSLQRGAVVIGAAARAGSRSPERRPPIGVEIVLEVDDVRAEHDLVVAAGWKIEEPLRGQPWGLTDFRVLDPSGYYLRVTDGRADLGP